MYCIWHAPNNLKNRACRQCQQQEQTNLTNSGICLPTATRAGSMDVPKEGRSGDIFWEYVRSGIMTELVLEEESANVHNGKVKSATSIHRFEFLWEKL